jgi:AraC-like DNA-binding protein
MIVRQVLNALALNAVVVDLGEVEIVEDLDTTQYTELKAALASYGLELMEHPRNILIEKIKKVVIEMVHYNEDPPTENFSTHLARILHYDYTYLSNLFAEVKGITIEHYIIAHKIERVKELLIYDELTLTEIAYKLHYSSVAHLSNQFKKVTGLTPSFFKKLKNKRFKGHDEI